jgi:hypothetical protein
MNAPSSDVSNAAVGWFPVFTLVVGYVVGYGTLLIQHWLSVKRDREARNEARRDQLAERRASFQRQTLLDLQQAVQDLGRTTGAIHHQDMQGFKKTGKWQNKIFPSDLDEKDFLANARTSMLRVRVRDEKVRELANSFQNQSYKVTQSESRDASEHAFIGLISVGSALHNRIGEVLRTLDDYEDTLVSAKKN